MASGKNVKPFSAAASGVSLTRGQARPKRVNNYKRVSDEEMTRAAELWEESPGDIRRIKVRLFREFGTDRDDSTIRTMLVRTGRLEKR